MSGTVRIIGGKHRGIKLNFPEELGLRPTPDRVRETVFNWLMDTVQSSHCLDAFAGSGALGFEALSRGAEKVIMVEQSSRTFNYLKKNLDRLDSSKVAIVREDFIHYVSSLGKTFDIIFLDPPFKKNFIPTCVHLIENHNLLNADGFLYLESEEHVELCPEKWEKYRFKKTGQVHYALYKKILHKH